MCVNKSTKAFTMLYIRILIVGLSFLSPCLSTLSQTTMQQQGEDGRDKRGRKDGGEGGPAAISSQTVCVEWRALRPHGAGGFSPLSRGRCACHLSERRT